MVVRKTEEASQRIEGMGEEPEGVSGEYMSNMSKTVSTYMRKGSEYLDQMDVQEELKNLETNVQKNPLQSVLIAAGAGLVLGMLLRGR